jgi:hypothetical protein
MEAKREMRWSRPSMRGNCRGISWTQKNGNSQGFYHLLLYSRKKKPIETAKTTMSNCISIYVK